MPFRWEKWKNPYICNYFGMLQVGPNVSHQQIAAKARELIQKIAAGQKISLPPDHELDEHAVSEASTKLRDPRSAAEELLLVHPQPETEERSRIKALVEQVRKKAALPSERAAIPLRDPLGVFWFAPTPGVEAAELPEWAEFGLTSARDPEDLALDIVFDR
jgi:hypothetical protein